MKVSLRIVLKNLTRFPTLIVLGALVSIGAFMFRQLLFSGEAVNASDILTQQYFWNIFTKEHLLSDPCFRTWLPYINAGAPFAGGLNLLFRPINFLTLLLLPVHIGLNYEIVLYLIGAGVSMYVYMRELKLSHTSGFLAALFMMLNVQLVSLINAGHVNKLGTIALTPLVFWSLERALRCKTLKAFLTAGGVLALQFWQTHIQISFYTCIGVGIYFLLRVAVMAKNSKKKMRGLPRLFIFALLMVVVFLLLSAVEFLPWISFAQVSDRAEGVSYEFATSWSMPPEELVTYLVPGFFGFRRLNFIEDENIVSYWGRMPFTQTGHYLGLIPLLLMLLALCFVRNKHVLTLGVLAFVILLLGMGKYFPAYKFLYDYVPGFNKFRVPQMILFLFAFAASALAGFGAEWLFSGWSTVREKRLRIFLLAGVALLMLVGLLVILFPLFESNALSSFSETLLRKGADRELAKLRLEASYHETIKFTVLFGIALFALSLRLTQIRRRWFLSILLLVFLVDIGLFNDKYIDTIPLEGSHYTSENDAIRYCKENPGLYRIYPALNEPHTYNVSNKYVLHELSSISGYEAVGVQYYDEFLERMALGTPLVDLLNIKYIILPKNVEIDGKKPEIGKMFGPYHVVMNSDAVLLENLNVLPRAYAVHNAYLAKSKEETFSMLQHPTFNPREFVVLEEEPQVAMSQEAVPSSKSSVEITHYVTRTIRMRASMATDGFLVLSERFYPGWKAYVNGKETEIYKANHTLQAIAVPRGEHQIEFLFQPRQYWLGFWITCGTLLPLVAYLFMAGKFGRTRGAQMDPKPELIRFPKYSNQEMFSICSVRILPFCIRFIAYSALGVLFVAAFLNIQYGIDHLSMIAVFSADEAFAVQLLAQNVQENRLDPQGFYNYGYFYHSLVFYTAKFLGTLNYTIDERFLAYVFRWISLASYSLLLYVTYAFTAVLTKNRLFSLCATLFLASVPGVYSWGQQTHPDMLQAFLVTSAAYVACRRHNLIHVIGAAILAGLAFSTKYTGIFILPFVSLPFLFAAVERKQRRHEKFLVKDLGNFVLVVLGASGIFLLVWLVTNPTVLQNYSEVVKDILFEKRHVAWGDGQAESKNPLLWFTLLFQQFKLGGSLLLLLGFVSLGDSLRKHLSHWPALFSNSVNRCMLVLLVYSITNLGYLMLQVNLRKDRYILHLLPILVVLGFSALYRLIDDSPILRKGKMLLSVVLLVIALPLGLSTVQAMHEASQKYDHQYLQATAWIEQNYPPDTFILADSYSYRSPRLSHFMQVWGVEREALEYAQPQLVILNKMLSGRWSWKKPGTKFADLDFILGPYEAKREMIQEFHKHLFASESLYKIVYEDTDIVILEDSRKMVSEMRNQ